MKRIFGVSILSAMLVLGQPLMAFADTTGTRAINFEDIEGIITEQNIQIHINENDRLKSEVGTAKLKKTIRELENDLDDIEDEKDKSGNSVGLSGSKRALLATLKQLERNAIDLPTAIAITDLQASMSDDAQTITAESLYIGYNQLKYASSDISLSIDTLQDQLVTMELREKLGLISYNTMNDLKTKLVDMETKLKSTMLQQDLIERQLKDLINDQENTLLIGSIPTTEGEFVVKDKEADLKLALENNYTIKLLEQQIVILQAVLERAQKDNGMSSYQYREANYELSNANLQLSQLKNTLNSSYFTMIDNISRMQSNLHLAEQTLEDKKVALSEAQVRLRLGMISQLEMDSATTGYQVQVNDVETKQIELFNARSSYNWFLRGISSQS